LITGERAKSRRHGVFIDTKMNGHGQQIVSVYSVRPLPSAPVSAPLRWDEVFELHPDELTTATVPDRLDRLGDPWQDIDEAPQSLEPLLAMHERDRAGGLLDAPWPPVYPKMPDEPPRVAPSRARKPASRRSDRAT
jgi:DNA primase